MKTNTKAGARGDGAAGGISAAGLFSVTSCRALTFDHAGPAIGYFRFEYGFFFSRKVSRIGVPGRSKLSRRLLTR
jgi:hypothetical protein